jgi:hypothetical protein
VARQVGQGIGPRGASIGFTGTPIELTDRNTRAVFGDYIDVYDIQRAVEDGNTVRIYYEGRLAKLELDEAEKPKIDPEFEEVTKSLRGTHWGMLWIMSGGTVSNGLLRRVSIPDRHPGIPVAQMMTRWDWRFRASLVPRSCRRS